jgi:hypothetical protein
MKLAGGRCHLLALCDRHHKLEFASAFGGLSGHGPLDRSYHLDAVQRGPRGVSSHVSPTPQSTKK